MNIKRIQTLSSSTIAPSHYRTIAPSSLAFWYLLLFARHFASRLTLEELHLHLNVSVCVSLYFVARSQTATTRWR